MRRHLIRSALIIFALAAGAYVYFKTGDSRQEVIERVFGSQELFNSFVAAKQVSAQRLHMRVDQEFSTNELGNYLRGQLVKVPASQSERLKRLMERPSSYYQGSAAKACIPDYGVLFTFSSDKQVIQVALCFNCNMLRILDGGTDNARGVNTSMDFDPMRSGLVAIVKKVFPEDAEIQNLDGRR